MDLLEKFAPQKKKPLVLTNVGKRAIGACYIPVGSVNLKNSESSVPGIISKIKYVYGRTYLPTQRTRRKRAKKKEKKNLVWPTERTIWPQTTSRIHTGCIKGRGTSPGPSQRLPWPQSANVCEEHTDTTFALIYRMCRIYMKMDILAQHRSGPSLPQHIIKH